MSFNFTENEKNILKFWQEKKIFEKLQEKLKGKKTWSFLDGPITANNPMGVHHAWGRTYKDVFQRYKARQGFDQRFQNGFDCQGLWVEVEVEKELGFKNKKDIENFGIDKFVDKCKARVMKYSGIQTEQSIRLGQWMDWQNSYYTMSDENNYSIWHFLKKCHQKKLLYKGHDVVPWCPRCGTAISQHEILTEEYKELTHKALYVKFPVIGEKNTYFLAWTTTPWTLPGNVALAVHPDLVYSKVKDSQNNIFILLKEKAELVENGEIVEEFKGKELENLVYQGIFDDLSMVQESLVDYKHKVIFWKDISQEEGTGIVHIAPGCGEEDFQLSKEYDLAVINPTDDESRYLEGFAELSGKFVGSDKVREWIINNLTQKDRVYKTEDYTHRYPTCWRCKTELIFRLVDEWYISMGALRQPLIKSAKKVKWIPAFGLDRELDWLKNMKDWLISKKRYWGLALPIWQCSCGCFEVIGSKEELKEKAVEGWQNFEGHSPHRPWVDKVKIKCPKCGKLMNRTADVGNPWLDAGIVPFSTIKYFSDKKYWRKWFPVEFICESFPGQFKNWFYAILVMSQVLEDKAPFKTLLGYASVVDEKGEEMHKSKGNAIWFDEAVEKIGADVMRWMYVRQNPVSNMRFGYNLAKETERKLLTLLNCYTFFETYAEKSKAQFKSQNLLDKWILSRLNGLVEKTTKAMNEYNVASASEAIENFFINDLSLWYVRRSRKRFQQPANEKEKSEAEQVLYYLLLALTKLISPMMPFFAEKMYQDLRTADLAESVHLSDWPKVDKKMINKKLEEEMQQIRNVVSQALAKRTELGIRVRQPLQKIKIKNEKLKITIKNERLSELIKDEINIREIIFDDKIKEEIELDTNITSELAEEGQIREFIRQIQDLRKKAGLTPKDRILIFHSATADLEKVLRRNEKEILKETRAEKMEKISSGQKKQAEEIKINGEKISISIQRSK